MDNNNKNIITLNNEVKELKKIREKLMSIISHDLKTPLTSVIGFARLVKQRPSMAEETKEKCLDAVLAESERILKMLDSILTWQQIEADKIKLFIEPVNPGFILLSTAKSFQKKLEENNLKLITDIEENLKMPGDKNRLYEVLENLLWNAVKYTKSGEEIKISAFKDADGTINITISNRGREVEGDIFNEPILLPGERGEKGLGLGVFIARRLVEIHGGEIAFTSTDGLNKFHLKFPQK